MSVFPVYTHIATHGPAQLTRTTHITTKMQSTLSAITRAKSSCRVAALVNWRAKNVASYLIKWSNGEKR